MEVDVYYLWPRHRTRRKRFASVACAHEPPVTPVLYPQSGETVEHSLMENSSNLSPEEHIRMRFTSLFCTFCFFHAYIHVNIDIKKHMRSSGQVWTGNISHWRFFNHLHPRAFPDAGLHMAGQRMRLPPEVAEVLG